MPSIAAILISNQRITTDSALQLIVTRFFTRLPWEGFDVVFAPVDADGIVDVRALESLIDEQVALVSVMAMNNEVGAAQPIGAVAELCRRADAVFHSDAAQPCP